MACGVHTFILSWAPAKGYGLNFYIFRVCAALLEAIRRMLTHSMPPSLIRCCEALAPSDAAAGYTAETMNTTIASAGTAVNLVEDAWNTRAGYDMAFAPEEAPECINGVLLVIRSAAPADAVTIRATVWVEELA